MSEQYIDWEVVLGELQVAAEFPDSQYLEELMYSAKNWVSCPCGNLDEAIPRGAYHEPNDPVLKELGKLFSDYVDLMTDPGCTVANINGLANASLIVLDHIELRGKAVMEWVSKNK